MFVSSTRWTFLLLILITGNALADTNYNSHLNIQEPIVCSASTTRHLISLDQNSALIRLEDLVSGVDYHLFVLPAQPDKDCLPVANTIVLNDQLKFIEPGIYSFRTPNTYLNLSISGETCIYNQSLTLSIGKIKDQQNTLTVVPQGIEINLDTYSVEELVEDVFIGGDCFQVEPGSITFEGDEESIGFFSSGNDALNVEEGIILSTGKVEDAIGPNSKYNTGTWIDGPSNDPDLEQLLAGNYNLRDRASLEFDFTPTSEMISFEFVFASEEYCEYVNTDFNDVFGFFISGPGINGPFSDGAENIAFVPGSNDYISINSVNHLQNQFFFNNNIPINQHDDFPNALSCPELENDQGVATSFLEYDGFTAVMTAMAQVAPCETYHIKLVISDVQDAYFDSAVFLKANSFSGGSSAEISVNVPGFGGDELTEDCTEGYFRFDRIGEDLSEDVVIRFTVSELSTATPGVDYEALPDSIIIPAGEAFYNLPILAFNDNLTEGIEDILLEMEVPCSCSNPYSTIFIRDGDPLTAEDANRNFCEGQSALLMAQAEGGVGTLTYLWNTGDTLANLSVMTTQSTDYSVTITDECGKTVSATHHVTIASEPTATLSGETILCENIPSNSLPINLTGTGPWDLEYTLNGVPQNPVVGIVYNNFQLPVTTPGIYLLTAVNSNGCEGMPNGSGIVTAINLEITEQMEPLTCPDAANGSLFVSAEGGNLPYQFLWENGVDGPELIGLDTGQYQVTLTDGNGCETVEDISVFFDPEMPMLEINSADTLTCHALEVNLLANASQGQIYEYLWNTNNGFIQEGNNTLAPIITMPGEYVLEVINTNTGCRQADTLTVIQDILPPDPLVLVQGPQTLTCTETTTILDATGSLPFGEVSFTWSTENGYLNPTIINDPIPEIDSAGLYQLLLTNVNNGCTASLSTLIDLNVFSPNPVIAIPAELTCLDTIQELDATNSNSQGAPIYSWSTIDGNLLNGISGLNPEVDTPGTYQLEILDTENGCIGRESITVIENKTPPIAEIMTPTEALDCNTFMVDLNGSNSSQGADVTYEWNTNNGELIGALDNSIVTGTEPGDYQLVVTDQRNGCVSMASTTIIQNLVEPVADIAVLGQPILTCEFPTTRITAAGSIGENDLSFRWFTNDGGLTTSQLTQIENEILTPGVYQLEVTDQVNACTNQAEVLITEDKVLPFINIGFPSVLNCYRDTISLSGIGSETGVNYAHSWRTLDGNIIGNSAELLTVADQPGAYQLETINTNNGCSNAETITVSENRIAPEFSIAPILELLDCNTPELELSAIGELMETFTFTWATDGGNILTNPIEANITVDAAGVYELLVTDIENGCVTEVNELVEVNNNHPEMIEVELEAPVCFGETGSLSILGVTGGEGPYLFSLDIFENEIFFPDTVFQGIQPANFNLTVQDINGCKFTESITLPGVPELTVTTDPLYEIQLGESQELNATVNTPSSWIDSVFWSHNSQITCVNCFDPIVQPFENTNYTVTVIDENGCKATSQTLVKVDKERRVYIPNAFSPNGDGQNEVVTVFTDRASVLKVNTFQVFSRWGEKIFENNDFQPNLETEGWNGLFGGEKMMSGVYVYFVEIEFVDGHKEVFKGDITLLR